MSVFISRFSGLSDPGKIIESATVRPKVISHLETLEPRMAMTLLSDRLKNVFIPNEFAVDFISEMVAASLEYSTRKYSDKPSYFRSIFHPSLEEVFPICLTGLAGVGKSALISALSRALPESKKYLVPDSVETLSVHSHWISSARDKPTTKQMLVDFLGINTSNGSSLKGSTHSLLNDSRRYAGKIGVSLIVLEELQHMTFSATATASVTSQILTFAKLGVPMVFVCNYSLVNKLLNRNIEEVQRILAKPRVMLPDQFGSNDWNLYVQECTRILGKYNSVELDPLSIFLYFKTYGLKRLAINLISLAYFEARKKGRHCIDMEDFLSAELSSEYLVDRKYVLALVNQEKSPAYRSNDIFCPFEIPRITTAQLITHYDEINLRKIGESALNSSLRPGEKAVLNEIKDDYEAPLGANPPIRRKSSSLEDLKKGYERSVLAGRKVEGGGSG